MHWELAATVTKFYVTTAILYVNALPHVGHAYELIATDAIARYKRLTGHDVFFLTGTDENSLNAERKARGLGLDPQAYVDQMAASIKEIWQRLNVSFDDFIRTTDERHKLACQEFFQRVYDRGDIYLGTYEGWYCVSCEAFYRADDLVDEKCPSHQTRPEWIKEHNYFFALSKYQDRLLQHIEANPAFIQPESRRNEILSFVRSGLQDFSISRASMRWGIPVPLDPAQVIYVWFDALINYLTGVGWPTDPAKYERYWPADTHIVGKDIIRFHCVYWPAMLMSAGLPLPRRIFGHGFIYLKQEKMSKSLGTGIDPAAIADEFGADSLRYYILREVPFGRDGDFTWEGFVQRHNSDLANDLGNLLNRTVSMVNRYFGGTVPPPQAAATAHPIDREISGLASDTFGSIESHMNNLAFSDALTTIWQFVNRANKYVEETAPWILAKTDRERLSAVMYNLIESCRLVAYAVYPFVPATAERIAEQLGIQLAIGEDWETTRQWGGYVPGTKVTSKPVPLFPKKEL
ncbi:MAG: methionine--tRNA ligase [Chloroflexi bacterium]|nr:methionine--tRNA ligase [Chloroflexota bacterium]